MNPHRASYGWTSNNSIFARLGMNYDQIAQRIAINGEPGLAWLDNMRAYGRMADPPNYKDKRVCGGNLMSSVVWWKLFPPNTSPSKNLNVP